jgi:N-acyl-L-homoserine lactone synthetase
MVEIVTPKDRYLYGDYLEDMYRQRYRVLVEEAGWQIPGVKTDYDRDAFDNEDAVYLLEIDDQSRQLIASARFLPTDKPHMMSEVFAHHCEIEGVQRSPNIWEATRYVFERDRIAPDKFMRARFRMSIAMNEFCLNNQIASITWLTHNYFFQKACESWPTRALGEMQHYDSDGADYVASISDMTRETLSGLYAKLGEPGPVLFKRTPVAIDLPTAA